MTLRMYRAQFSSSGPGSIQGESELSCSDDAWRPRGMRCDEPAGESGLLETDGGPFERSPRLVPGRVSSCRFFHREAMAMDSTLSTKSCDWRTSRVLGPVTSKFCWTGVDEEGQCTPTCLGHVPCEASQEARSKPTQQYQVILARSPPMIRQFDVWVCRSRAREALCPNNMATRHAFRYSSASYEVGNTPCSLAY